MPDLPKVVTLLLIHVESGRLPGQPMVLVRPALERYDAVLRQALERHAGRLCRNDSDTLLASFATAEAAMMAALDVQSDLRESLPVGMALQTGPVEAMGDDCVGVTANRVARLLRIGHGGQVLVSQATWRQLGDRLPTGVTLREVGQIGWPGLIPQQSIFQLVAPDLPVEFPPLKSLANHAHNLPTQLTTFVGREDTVDEIERLLATSRLVTLTGAGGIGKTRLALAVAGDLLGVVDGVWMVELAGISDSVLVPHAVASVLGVAEEPDRALLDTLHDCLRGKRALLLLDYCEHIVEACANLSQALLSACPDLRILATSREPLDIEQEVTFTVLPLTWPDLERLPFTGEALVSALGEYEAVRLFGERAAAVRSTFKLASQNALTVSKVCRRLDGIPMAIELVASNMSRFSIEQIADKLNDRFQLLTGGRYSALPRELTLRAVIGWASHLLSEPEQILLRRLSVFAGGWTMDAAESVCWGRGLETNLITGLLDRLEALSFVILDAQGGTRRYRMLEMIRQYGRDRLLDVGETAWVQDRYLDYYLRLIEEAEEKLQGAEQSVWLERLEIEYNNLRAAMEWGQASPASAEEGLRLASALWRFWYMRGYLSEGRMWLEGALMGAKAGTSARGRAFNAVGQLAFAQGDLIASRLFHEESLAIRRGVGDKRGVADSLCSLGQVLRSLGEYGRAQSLFEQGLAVSRELGNNPSIATLLYNLGNVLFDQGDHTRAAALLRESIRLWRELNNAGALANCFVGLGRVTGAAGTPEAAAHAARLLGAASILLDTIGIPLRLSDRTEYDAGVATVRAQLDETTFAAAWAEGRAMTRERAIAYALKP